MPYFIVRPQYKQKGNKSLNDSTWAEIQQAVQAGKASDYWAVGDRKAITLNGTVGAKTFSNQTVYAYILGFNHNASVEGNNTIHFQFGFDALTGGNHIAFCDSNYGNAGSTSAFRMNTTNTNKMGWSGSYMRNTIIPAFINAMPSDLQAVLKTVNKYTDNANTTSHNTSSYVTSTQDKVFLLAEYEILGTRGMANQYEKNSQAQYDYYKNGGDKIMYNDNSTSSAVIFWERSPYYYSSGTNFCASANGSWTNIQARYSEAFAPAFVVG